MDKHQISGEQIQKASISELLVSLKCDEHGLSSPAATERLALQSADLRASGSQGTKRE